MGGSRDSMDRESMNPDSTNMEGRRAEITRQPMESTTESEEGPRTTLAAKLLFLWFAVVATIWTVPMAACQVITHQVDPSARNFKRTASAWGRVILSLCGIRVKVVDNADLSSHEPLVFVSNHQNLLDILALSASLPYPFGFLAKQELSQVPFLGVAIRNSASIFIDKRDARSAVTSLKAAGERIRAGNSVLVFVEGTRSYRSTLQPLKKGAFAVAVEAGVPMVPVTIVDAYRLMNEKKKLMRRGTIHIVIGHPIDLKGKTRRHLPELMEDVRERMNAELSAAHRS